MKKENKIFGRRFTALIIDPQLPDLTMIVPKADYENANR